MDRVVCGDVGFGKTEVALRSAFVAVQAGFQVAVLVPTTLLAEQHHRTFKDRFADWPVRVELLSRFRGASGVGGGPRRARRRHRRHRDRHAQAAAKRRALQTLGPRDRRRGAPLRRQAQGAPEALARRGRHADADGDADPAHAEHDARRLARSVDHRDAAGRAARREDVRRRVERPADPRGRAARDPPRRPDLLRPQPRREHRGGRRGPAQAAARSRGSRRPRPDVGARARARDARLLSPRVQRARLHDDHRERHRHPDRQHDHHQSRRSTRAWRSCISCAAASAARTIKPTRTCSRRRATR